MAIEFRCIRCGQRLRVADSDAGKRARCPTCNAVVDVPTDEQSGSPIVIAREKSDVIDYEFFGAESQYVEITLDPGEVTAARIEHLIYMSPGIAPESAAAAPGGADSGGILERISNVGRRILAGTSLDLTAFCNVAEQREVVAFGPTTSGRLVPIHLNEYEKQLTCDGDAVLCVARGIEMSDTAVDELASSATMQRIVGDGIAILQVSNQLVHRQLGPRKTMIVRSSRVVAFTAGIRLVSFENGRAENQMAMVTIHGPGQVWLKTGA